MSFMLTCKGTPFLLDTPVVMGIVNTTPDSFYDGGKNMMPKDIESRIEQLISEGASVIDIGGVSTRPGARLPDEKEEWQRLVPALRLIQKFPSEIIFSLDTFRAAIASRAVTDYGVAMINDISAGTLDNLMIDTIANLNVPYVIMHMQGLPETMQLKPRYHNLMKDVILFLSEKISVLNKAGINDIIIDPGFGFGKNMNHNFDLLNQLEILQFFKLPVLVGLSRKSLIYKTLGKTPLEALNGTTVLHAISLLKKVSILRVHDVKEAVETIKLVKQLISY